MNYKMSIWHIYDLDNLISEPTCFKKQEGTLKTCTKQIEAIQERALWLMFTDTQHRVQTSDVKLSTPQL